MQPHLQAAHGPEKHKAQSFNLPWTLHSPLQNQLYLQWHFQTGTSQEWECDGLELFFCSSSDLQTPKAKSLNQGNYC